MADHPVQLARAQEREEAATVRDEETILIEALCLSCLSESDLDPTFHAEVFEGEILDNCPTCGSESVARA